MSEHHWIDHKGRHFQSFAAMCYWWGITPRTVKRRLKDGRTLQEALDSTCPSCIPAKDHQGRRFASLTAMAKAWGIGVKVFHQRFARGWTIKRALTTAVRARRLSKFKETKQQ